MTFSSVVEASTITYQPQNPDICNKYDSIEVVYEEKLSASKVEIVMNRQIGKVSRAHYILISSVQKLIKKTVDKGKLFGENQLHQARQECVIQSMFRKDCIIRLYEYSEDQNFIYIFMEQANDPNYFENKLNVSELNQC